MSDVTITQQQARDYARQMITESATQWDWDDIAEGFDAQRVIEQPDCDLIAEALWSAKVTVTWDFASQ